ncbi:BREX-1 system phosphatase PglZ type A, partial [Candidatus Woesearchaeota archaeon]
MDKIAQRITQLFTKHRIVFWYDAKKELREEYEALTLPNIHKIELDNNEYGVKYRILRKEPHSKFLLYHEGPQPQRIDNWLLDVLLANGEFNADEASLSMAELGLGPVFLPLVQEHAYFFRAKSRLMALKARLQTNDDHKTIRTKMLAISVNAGAETSLESVL